MGGREEPCVEGNPLYHLNLYNHFKLKNITRLTACVSAVTVCLCTLVGNEGHSTEIFGPQLCNTLTLWCKLHSGQSAASVGVWQPVSFHPPVVFFWKTIIFFQACRETDRPITALGPGVRSSVYHPKLQTGGEKQPWLAVWFQSRPMMAPSEKTHCPLPVSFT